MPSDHYGGKIVYRNELAWELPSSAMPLLLITFDFHDYLVKLTIIGPFQNHQIQLLCVNHHAWNDLEKVYNAAVEMKKWILAYNERKQEEERANGLSGAFLQLVNMCGRQESV